jgi:hypothetical protein
MATRITPGKKVARSYPEGSVVTLDVGDHLPFALSDCHGVRFEAGPGAIIRGQGKATEFGVRINDGCSGLTFVGLAVTNAGHGLKATGSERLRFDRCRFFKNGVEGMVTGACDDLLIEDCLFEGNGAFRFQSYTSDKNHGLYLSWGGQRPVVRRCIFRGNTGSGLQINSTVEEGRPVIKGVEVEECQLIGNGSEGTPALSLISIANSILQRLYFQGNNAVGKLFQTSGVPCSGVVIADYTIFGPPGKFGLVEEGASKGKNSLRPGAGWRPGAAPTPEPEPPPVTSDLAELVALRTQERDAALAQLATTRDQLRGERERVAAWERWHGEAPVGATP